MRFKKAISFLLILNFAIATVYSQDSISTNPDKKDTLNKRLKIIVLTEGVFLVSSYFVFDYLWYKDYDKSKFHFFNDFNEWYGIDKMGHGFSAYWISNYNTQLFRWAGLNSTKSALFGTLSSFIYMASIELLDGYSSEWGASIWDLTANATGASLFLAQELLFKKQIVQIKYSYYPSNYSNYRPDVLGKSFSEKLIKDYNATKFWFSFDMNALISKKIPSWLNLAFGYGANGMTGGFENAYSSDCNCKPVPDSERAQEYYLSLDINLSKIKVRSKWLKTIFNALSMLKLPAPALEYSEKKWSMVIR